MATDRDVQIARENGHRADYNQAVAELRRFTGVEYRSRYGDRRTVAPDLSEPEHIAYQAYAADLAEVLAQLTHECETLDKTVDETFEKSLEADAALRKRLEERKAGREQSLFPVRAAGRIGDLFVKERAEVRELDEFLEKRRDLYTELTQDRHAVGRELNDVNVWLQAAKESLASI